MTAELIAGRYRLQQKIGEGGMAAVYRAVDVSLGREVAVKILRDDLALNPTAVQRFRREAHAAARLQHPNIVQIYDTGVQNGTYYIVMEYLREPDLKRILEEYAPLPLRKALEVGIQVCEAIEYAHNNDIVHRDIKPQNVLFTDDGRAKVGDFGIAAAAAAMESDSAMVLGSAHYMSPEQAQGHPPSPQSDLYSLGAILYEALTGRPPFEGDSAAEIAAKHVRERPKSPRALNANVTPSTEYVVLKALSKDLSRRYRTAAEMLHDLRKLQEGTRLERTGVLAMPAEPLVMPPMEPPESVVAPPVRPGPPLRPEQRIRPPSVEDEAPPVRTALAVAGGLVMALAIIGYVAWRVMYPNAPAARVQVPSVVGKTRSEAIAILAQAKLVLGNQTTQEDQSRQPGTIISQSLPFGEFVYEKTPVDVVVATGVGTVIVPDVVGQTAQSAGTILKSGGLVLGQVQSRYDESVPTGRIIEQDVRPGTNYPKGDAVNVVESRGPAPEEGVPAPGEEPGMTEAPPEEGSPTPEADVGPEPAPVISLDPGPGGVNVRVTVGGRTGRHRVKLMKTDEEARRLTVIEQFVEPGGGLNRWVDIKGSGTVQVWVDGELQQTYHSEPPPVAPSPAPSEGRDTR